jgi:hypothetical protein
MQARRTCHEAMLVRADDTQTMGGLRCVRFDLVASATGSLVFPPQLSSQRFLPGILNRHQDAIGVSCRLVSREDTR